MRNIFNPEPVEINYRNNSNVLFKRDFAKELLKKYKLKVLKHGFNWRYDPRKPTLDDTNWFLLKNKIMKLHLIRKFF